MQTLQQLRHEHHHKPQRHGYQLAMRDLYKPATIKNKLKRCFMSRLMLSAPLSYSKFN